MTMDSDGHAPVVSNSIENLQSNIIKLTIIKASKWLMLFMPIIWLFYAENGLSISDLFIIQGIYSVVIAIIEIPSGYLADIMGRKKAIVVGTFFGLVGMVIYSLSYGLLQQPKLGRQQWIKIFKHIRNG